MFLGLSLAGFLAVIVIVLVLIVVLLSIVFKFKKLDTHLKESQEDNVSPYLRTLQNYAGEDIDLNTRIDALNKISKQFFRDSFKYNSEKTFDEIAELSKDSDIKKFCEEIGVFRYSGKNLGKKEVGDLFRSFQNILVKRRPVRSSSSRVMIRRKPMTVEELLNRKMKRDITDIKSELGKMKSEGVVAGENDIREPEEKVNDTRPVESNLSSDSSTEVKSSQPAETIESSLSVEEKLAKISASLDLNRKPVQSVPQVPASEKEDAPAEDESTNLDLVEDIVKRQPRANGVKREPVKIPLKVRETIPKNKVVIKKKAPPKNLVKKKASTISREVRESAKVLNKKGISHDHNSLKFKKVRLDKLDKEEDELTEEITKLNQRLQRLVDNETERRLNDFDSFKY